MIWCSQLVSGASHLIYSASRAAAVATEAGKHSYEATVIGCILYLPFIGSFSTGENYYYYLQFLLLSKAHEVLLLL